MSATTIPYPLSNGSTVAAFGSAASGSAASGSAASTGVSGMGTGYAKATSVPIIYSSNGNEMRGTSVEASLAVIAGTMAVMCSVL